MARKDIFTSITAPDSALPDRKATPGYATRGASRSMISSLSELAEKAARADQLNGEAVVDLDPGLLDDSFVTDRMGDDEEAFRNLVEAIRERGQDTPILVRPHPEAEGRHQIVYGHRRVRAARLLGRRVKAVVKPVSDTDHVIAQGQENSARENLSFIERATFAQHLLDLGHERAVIQQALSVDAPMLTRMLSVTSRVPAALITIIGAAKGVGRDRWLEMAQQVAHPLVQARALELAQSGQFSNYSSEDRFEMLMAEIKEIHRPKRRATASGNWEASDASVSAEFKGAGKSYSISLKSRNAGRFGRYISENLERLHEEFMQAVKPQGD